MMSTPFHRRGAVGQAETSTVRAGIRLYFLGVAGGGRASSPELKPRPSSLPSRPGARTIALVASSTRQIFGGRPSPLIRDTRLTLAPTHGAKRLRHWQTTVPAFFWQLVPQTIFP